MSDSNVVVLTRDEIDRLRATLASRDKELSLLERDHSEARRDLATRDRELAEARDRLGEKRQLVKDATDTIARRNAERDELAAKLADVTFSAQQNWKLYDQARRELAEAREVAVLREAAIDDGRVKLNQARAALAEKEREYRELGAALGREQSTRVDLSRALAAAQEEAKGLRAALAAIARNDEDFDAGCRHLIIARKALAARQQQPDGKKEDGNG